jgi:hypothetical protein
MMSVVYADCTKKAHNAECRGDIVVTRTYFVFSAVKTVSIQVTVDNLPLLKINLKHPSGQFLLLFSSKKLLLERKRGRIHNNLFSS